MRLAKTLSILLLLLGIALQVSAQGDPNTPTISPITPGLPVDDTITEAAIFDWWVLRLTEGQTIEVTMTGQEGLAPLLGLLDENSELAQRSADGQPNGAVSYTYTAEATGEFRIIATRAGNADGTTVGPYTLQVNLLGAPAAPTPNPYREVTFDCDGQEVPNVLTVQFEDDKDQTDFISVSVYGLDGLEPSLRTTLEFDFEPFSDQFCITPDGEGPGAGLGDELRLPGEERIEWEGGVAKTDFRDADVFNLIHMNIGAMNDTSGRYVLVIDGMTIGRDGDRDLLELGLGPLAQETQVSVYALADKSSRLDSVVQLVDEGTDVVYTCDDAGSRLCDDVDVIEGFEWSAAATGFSAEGGRFDGGITLQPNSPDRQRILFGGFEGRTYGDYTVVIIGEFPPR